jgi:hypothetical protein
VVTRRALLGAGVAGGAALLSGCGPDGSSRLPPPGRALDAQLRAQDAVVHAYRGLPARVPAHAGELRRMVAVAGAAAARLRAAGAHEGAVAGADLGPPSLRRALAAEQLALSVHAAALGTGPRRLRTQTTELVVTAAQHAAVLRGMLGANPATDALPGAP